MIKVIRKDLFGNDISPSTYAIMEKNGVCLLKSKFKESWEKQNLFYKNTPEAIFFADMRGTSEVSICDDTRPLFSFRANDNVAFWKIRRRMKIELETLHRIGCPCRLPYNIKSNEGIFKGTKIIIYPEICYYGWSDGDCIFCGRNFCDDGFYCSLECQEAHLSALEKNCTICTKPISGGEWVPYYVSYFPEKIIFVHRKCREVITKADDFFHLRPSLDDTNRFYALRSQL